MRSLVSHMSFRRRLGLSLGFLSLLVAAVAGVTLWSLTAIEDSSDHVENNTRQSYLASQIVLQTLLCRRYEKDFFLNAGDIVAQETPLQQWHDAGLALRVAIKQYEDEASSPEDQARAARWRTFWGQYTRDFGRVEIEINGGNVHSAQDALRTFEPFQGNIQQLTDEAVQIAQEKSADVKSSSDQLSSTIHATMWAVFILSALVFATSVLWSIFFPQWLMRPIVALREGARRLAEGDYSHRVPVDRLDEIGQMAQSYNEMTVVIQQRTEELDHLYVQATQARVFAEAAHREVSAQLAIIEDQRAVIRDMSIPILPLSDSILMMPLIGTIDTVRLQQIHQVALKAIEDSSAKQLIVDITGVPVVDSEVGLGLMQVVYAARLLGCQVVLVGFRPEVAQSIVGLGIDLRNVITHGTLQSGLRSTWGMLSQKPN